jgi:Ca2+-binding EF-hand superfamily protein
MSPAFLDPTTTMPNNEVSSGENETKEQKVHHGTSAPTADELAMVSTSCDMATFQYSEDRRSTACAHHYPCSHCRPCPPFYKLLSSTNFSKREILDFYDNSRQYNEDDNDHMSLESFTALCRENGLELELLVGRLFLFLDVDKSNSISISEVITGIKSLLRGSLEDVAGMCFDLFDLDGVRRREISNDSLVCFCCRTRLSYF